MINLLNAKRNKVFRSLAMPREALFQSRHATAYGADTFGHDMSMFIVCSHYQHSAPKVNLPPRGVVTSDTRRCLRGLMALPTISAPPSTQSKEVKENRRIGPHNPPSCEDRAAPASTPSLQRRLPKDWGECIITTPRRRPDRLVGAERRSCRRPASRRADRRPRRRKFRQGLARHPRATPRRRSSHSPSRT